MTEQQLGTPIIDELQLIRDGLAGPYTVKRQIGQGGGACVYVALDTRHNRFVAMKVLHPDVAAAVGVERFKREIMVAARLVHPGITPVLDSGVCPTPDGIGRLWYSMPYVEGESLRERLKRDYILPVDVAISIGREIADALEYTHKQGIVHRDVKPENILLQGNRPLLADFGIAHVSEPGALERLTKAGVLLGTPQYMSPEQAVGERNLDARADVYSLGCVVYECLVGETPFNAPTPQAIIARMSRERPTPISQTRPTAALFDEPVLKALSRSPDDRFPSAAAFAKALPVPTTTLPDEIVVDERAPWLIPISIGIVILVAVGAWIAIWR